MFIVFKEIRGFFIITVNVSGYKNGCNKDDNIGIHDIEKYFNIIH
jgi:hypothetical protein